MPTLPLETDLYPETLFAGLDALPGAERQWWVLHVRPRQEKALARHVLAIEVPFFLPLTPRRRLLRGKVVHSHLPLFPGYVFILATKDEWLKSLSQGRVVRSLHVVDQERLWNDLRQVHRLIQSGSPVMPAERLGPGVEVEIQSGPLVGLRGLIIREATGRRFVVRVDFIQRGASVVLDDFALAAVEPTTAKA
jgi:transcription antitermination factor NusG